MSDEPVKGKPLDPEAMTSINASKFYPDEPWPQAMFDKAADTPPPIAPTEVMGVATQIASPIPPPPDDTDPPNEI